MNLPDVLDAWRLYVDAAITDVAGKPAKSILYHGKLPDDCCEEEGALGVWWATLDLSTSGLTPTRFAIRGRGEMQGAFQLVDLGARWNRCWYVPEAADLGSDATYARYNGDAALMALVADHVNLQLLRLTCGATTLGSGIFCEGARWTTTRPDISGDCAGIEWHIVAGLAGDTDTS